MTGREFVAVRRLSNAADHTLADAGETCERIPAESLPALLASGKIRPVHETPAPPRPGSGGDHG
jgi:hypothetical protein